MSLAADSWTKLHFHDSVPGFKYSPVGIRAQPKSRMKLVSWCASTASLAVWSQLLTPCCKCVCCNDAHMILPKLCLSAGFHDAADHAEGERSGQIPGFLHQNPRHDVGVWRRSRCSVTIAWKQELTFFFPRSHRLLQKFDFPSMRFSLFFLGYEDKKEIPTDVADRTAWTFSRTATLELTQ